MTTMTKLNWPEYSQKTGVTVLPEHILFITIDYDDFQENPCDMDYTGNIYSRSRRHRSYRDDVLDIVNENPDAVVLNYFEHGNCIWSVGHPRGTEGDWRWDGVDGAGVWVPSKTLLDEAKELTGEARRAKMVEWAEQACELYTYWCNGEVYCYSVRLYQLRKDAEGTPYDYLDDYRRDTPLLDESCCGYYGWDDVVACAKEALTALKKFNLEIE